VQDVEAMLGQPLQKAFKACQVAESEAPAAACGKFFKALADKREDAK
jgi:hypothetical protein